MTSARECIRLLEESGRVEKGAIQKLAAAALRLEIGEKAVHPIEALKELVGIKKPMISRIGEYVMKGIEEAKPRAGLAAVGLAGALGVGGALKLWNEAKYRLALADLKKDPEVQVEPDRAVSIANMVKRWAPSIAADPEILKGTVKNLMKFPDSYLTYDIAKKLSETEREYAGTHGLLSLLKQRLV